MKLSFLGGVWLRFLPIDWQVLTRVASVEGKFLVDCREIRVMKLQGLHKHLKLQLVFKGIESIGGLIQEAIERLSLWKISAAVNCLVHRMSNQLLCLYTNQLSYLRRLAYFKSNIRTQKIQTKIQSYTPRDYFNPNTLEARYQRSLTWNNLTHSDFCLTEPNVQRINQNLTINNEFSIFANHSRNTPRSSSTEIQHRPCMTAIIISMVYRLSDRDYYYQEAYKENLFMPSRPITVPQYLSGRILL